jgi:hypothetical protein
MYPVSGVALARYKALTVRGDGNDGAFMPSRGSVEYRGAVAGDDGLWVVGVCGPKVEMLFGPGNKSMARGHFRVFFE